MPSDKIDKIKLRVIPRSTILFVRYHFYAEKYITMGSLILLRGAIK